MAFRVNRRDFIKTVGAASLLTQSGAGAEGETKMETVNPPPDPSSALDLSPAKWIWYPSERTLPNTFLLFRRQITVNGPIRKASGWIAVDSRYKLFINGRYVQFGPAPCDPRWLEADPLDLTALFKNGENIIGVQALFYGFGDGTWPIGKAGFIFYLEIEDMAGGKQTIVSDQDWLVNLCRAWRPGQYKRWYLRSLQEEFDSRRYPYGWTGSNFNTDAQWLPAMELEGKANQPALNASYPEYMLDVSGSRSGDNQLRRRSVPMMIENMVKVEKLSESYLLRWQHPIEDYFEFLTPNAFSKNGTPTISKNGVDSMQVACPAD